MTAPTDLPPVSTVDGFHPLQPRGTVRIAPLWRTSTKVWRSPRKAASNQAALSTQPPIHISRRTSPRAPWRYERSEEFFELFAFVASTMGDADDYARCVYESLEDGVRTSNLRYREMFFNPTLHTRRGVPISVVLEGMAAGIAAAKSDLGVDCRLIADVFRSDPPAEALAMVSDLINERNDALIGLGMDGEEAPDRPRSSPTRSPSPGPRTCTGRAMHRRATRTYLSRPARCERVDHGYTCSTTPFSCACRDGGIGYDERHTTSRPTRRAQRAPHPRMIDADLVVSLGSDDPTMVHTDLAQEYLQLSAELSYGPSTIRRLCLNALETSWLDDDESGACAESSWARSMRWKRSSTKPNRAGPRTTAM